MPIHLNTIEKIQQWNQSKQQRNNINPSVVQLMYHFYGKTGQTSIFILHFMRCKFEIALSVSNVVVSLDGQCKQLCCIAVLNTMSAQEMEEILEYLLEPFYSDLALGYFVSGPEPTINTKRCPANNLF